MDLPDIGELIGAMAVDAINVQVKFNQYFESEIQRMKDLLAAVQRMPVAPAAAPELLLPLRPCSLRMREFELSFGVGISVTRDEEFAVQAIPLNAEFFIRTSARTDRHSRVTFSVQQTPIS
jgi:hypothetical protein